MTRNEINDATGFANGDTFANPAEVYAYFTPAAQAAMFGDDAVIDAETLLGWAEAVIGNCWHCAWKDVALEERGNGLPDVGDYVIDGDDLYRITRLGSYVHTGGPGRGNTIFGQVNPADWDECEDERVHSARLTLL